MYRNNVGINIIYHFKYYPTSWSNWNKIAQIRASIQLLLVDIEWREYEYERSNIMCIESDFKNILKNDIKFYKSPSIQSGYKHEVRSVLGIECKNLWYQNFFFVEKVIAFSLWLSQTYPHNKHVHSSNRVSIKRAWSSYYNFNKIKDEYKQRLTAKERKSVYADRNKRTKTKPFKDEVIALLKKGVSPKEIMSKYKVTKGTLSNWKRSISQ